MMVPAAIESCINSSNSDLRAVAVGYPIRRIVHHVLESVRVLVEESGYGGDLDCLRNWPA